MIGSSFKNQIHNAIALFESYKQKRGNTNDGVSLDLLITRIESLKSDSQSLSQDALNKQLNDILEKIKVGYQHQLNQIDDILKIKKISKKSPQEFENNIVRFKEKHKGYENLIQVTRKELKEKCNREILKFNTNNHEIVNILLAKTNWAILLDVEKMRKYVSQTQDEWNLFASQFTKDLVGFLNEKLETERITFEEIYKITLPQVELDELLLRYLKTEKMSTLGFFPFHIIKLYEIIPKRRINTGENDSFIEASWNRETRKYEFYSEGQPLNPLQTPDRFYFLNSLIEYLKQEFEMIKNHLTGKIDEVFHLYIAYFDNKIEDIKFNLKSLIVTEKKEKIKNDQLILEIKELKFKKDSIQPELNRIEEFLEDLK